MSTFKYKILKIVKSISFIIIVSELLLLLIFHMMGFKIRIIYGPELKANWDAINAIGQWCGVIVGLLIPIAAVYLQDQLDKSKKDIGESNAALLEEVKKFKIEYEEKLKSILDNVDEKGNIILDGGSVGDDNKQKYSIEELKKEAYKFVNVSMVTRTKRVAEYLDISPDKAFDILEELLRNDELISAGGIITKDNIDTIVWTKKNNR